MRYFLSRHRDQFFFLSRFCTSASSSLPRHESWQRPGKRAWKHDIARGSIDKQNQRNRVNEERRRSYRTPAASVGTMQPLLRHRANKREGEKRSATIETRNEKRFPRHHELSSCRGLAGARRNCGRAETFALGESTWRARRRASATGFPAVRDVLPRRDDIYRRPMGENAC